MEHNEDFELLAVNLAYSDQTQVSIRFEKMHTRFIWKRQLNVMRYGTVDIPGDEQRSTKTFSTIREALLDALKDVVLEPNEFNT